jgi:hypothetical protein
LKNIELLIQNKQCFNGTRKGIKVPNKAVFADPSVCMALFHNKYAMVELPIPKYKTMNKSCLLK